MDSQGESTNKPNETEMMPFTDSDFEIACNVMRILGQDEHVELYNSPYCRPFRNHLQPFIKRQKEKMFSGGTHEEHNLKRAMKIRRAQEVERKKREDQEFLKRTVLRAGRMKRLEEVALRHGDDGPAVPLLLDGVAEDGVNASTTLSLPDLAPSNLKISSESSAKETDSHDINAAEAETPKLNGTRGCYICKRRYQILHHFYDTLCESCAALNWRKRMQACNMQGRICLVTGGRVKIGFQCCLKLLRCGATVIATSRFPGDTAVRYAAQSDFNDWKDRLHVVGIDLRDLAAIEELCRYLQTNFPWLDVIINNACQTIRRPHMYYNDVVEVEKLVAAACLGSSSSSSGGQEGKPSFAEVLEKNWEYQRNCELNQKWLLSSNNGGENLSIENGTSNQVSKEKQADMGQTFISSVQRSQQMMVADDVNLPSSVFPSQIRDVNSQQIDLRKTNSWLLTLSSGEISTPELAEVFAINAMAPFILASKLKSLLIAVRPISPSRDMKRSFGAIDTVVNDSLHELWNPQMSLADSVLQQLQGNLGCGSDPHQAKRLRSAWKGGGNIQGHFSDDNATHTQPRATDEENKDATEIKRNSNPDRRAAPAGDEPLQVKASECKFIVNVSSMEGKFYRRKLATHPHTNMAKAALNMLTRTSAAEYEKHNIYMTAVDTGWINDENPLERAAKTAETHNFATPLDEVDAAARILDPVFAPLIAAQRCNGGGGLRQNNDCTADEGLCSPPFGCFLKDYFPTEW